MKRCSPHLQPSPTDLVLVSRNSMPDVCRQLLLHGSQLCRHWKAGVYCQLEFTRWIQCQHGMQVQPVLLWCGWCLMHHLPRQLLLHRRYRHRNAMPGQRQFAIRSVLIYSPLTHSHTLIPPTHSHTLIPTHSFPLAKLGEKRHHAHNPHCLVEHIPATPCLFILALARLCHALECLLVERLCAVEHLVHLPL